MWTSYRVFTSFFLKKKLHFCGFVPSHYKGASSREFWKFLYGHTKKRSANSSKSGHSFCVTFLFHLSAFSRHLFTSPITHLSPHRFSNIDFCPILQFFSMPPAEIETIFWGWAASFTTLLCVIVIFFPPLYDNLRLGQESAFSPSSPTKYSGTGHSFENHVTGQFLSRLL